MRIGIYGGTFNPIHTAHVHLVREFIKRLSLDRVILIPTGTPPHKATHQLASGADRIEMQACGGGHRRMSRHSLGY